MHRIDLLPDKALDRIANTVAAVGAAEAVDLPWREKVRIHFLRNFTIEPLEPYLKFHLLREDIQPHITFGGYDTMVQEVLDPESILSRDRPDVIVLSLLVEMLDSTSASRSWNTEHTLSRLNRLFFELIDKTNSVIVANLMIPPIEIIVSGHLDKFDLGKLDHLNARLTDIAAKNNGRLIISDWRQYTSRIAVDDAFDKRFWKSSLAPFKKEVLNRIAADVVRTVRILKGQAKKCLVLDCDNTLWGGVVGEDGIDGIQLAPGDSDGGPYHRLQESVLALHERGVMIAFCSKNNEQDVWSVIETHPHCLLKRSHLVAWRINWENKAENIVNIADELNIGLESIVFVDDSPHECALIRDLLPQVTTIQVPVNLSENQDILTRDGLFDTLTMSKEDRMRTRMYQDEWRRKKERNKTDDLTEYLKSLSTSLRIGQPSNSELARVAQLTQKTNQFNLTTRRYSEPEIRACSVDKDMAVYSMSVNDRFGDMGVTGVFIAKRAGSKGIVETLLLSCRVLGRQLEFAFVDQCMRQLEDQWNIDNWIASYVPTRKNTQVADFWDHIGFELVSDDSGVKSYTAKSSSRPNEYLKIMSIEMELLND